MALVGHGLQIARDAAEGLGELGLAEATGDFLHDLAHAQVSLGAVVREGDVRVLGEELSVRIMKDFDKRVAGQLMPGLCGWTSTLCAYRSRPDEVDHGRGSRAPRTVRKSGCCFVTATVHIPLKRIAKCLLPVS